MQWHCVSYLYSATNFSIADSIYTERYMGTPKDNPIGYNVSKNHNHYTINSKWSDTIINNNKIKYILVYSAFKPSSGDAK